MTWPILRQAMLADIPELVAMENEASPDDVISKRSWRGLIGSAAAVIVAEDFRELLGDYVLLLNRRTEIARLYSISVAQEYRHRGIAKLLTQDAIVRSLARGATHLRLTIRADDLKAQSLFTGLGFIPFKREPNNYQDGAEAIRLERRLIGGETS